jgi:sulfite exporter TauE/SafE
MSLALCIAALVAGFAGSGHCVGMCGPIVGMFESTPAVGHSPLRRRIGYHVGRLGFYLLLGAVVGVLGTALAASMPAKTAAMTLRLLAALALIMVGLRLMLGKRRTTWLDHAGQSLWQHVSPLARFVLPMSSLPKSFAAGFIWGAMPCGLVYSVLSVAAVSGSAPHGALVMLAFWLGTLPALAAVGAGARRAFNARFRKLSGAALVVAACVSIGALWPSHDRTQAAAAPSHATEVHAGHH